MKYIVLPLLLLSGLLSVQAQEQKTVFHDKDAQLRNVGDFHAIDVSSAIDLQISQGDENSVAVSAEGDENRAAIKTQVRFVVMMICL
jgi:hypothetical protein